MPSSFVRRAAAVGATALLSAGTAMVGSPAAHAATTATCTSQDPTFSPTTFTCPTIVSVVPSTTSLVRSNTNTLVFSVNVSISDPDKVVTDLDTVLGKDLLGPSPQLAADDWIDVTSQTTNATRYYKVTVHSPYVSPSPESVKTPYGAMQVLAAGWNSFNNAQNGVDAHKVASTTVTIKAMSVATNTPSATSIHTGQQFTERGTLKRFDGTPIAGQRVSVYYIPAGTTRASFAGYATTSSTGALALAVRSWHTGSWMISFPGSSTDTSTYKGAWVRVS